MSGKKKDLRIDIVPKEYNYSVVPVHEKKESMKKKPIPSFKSLDIDSDGVVTFDEFRNAFSSLPTPDASKLFQEADTDGDGFISPKEYKMFYKMYRFADSVILPQNAPKKYEYSCLPPPLFMIIITIVEAIVFAYHAVMFKKQGIYVHKYGPAPTDSYFLYNPYKRHEVWRYLTYMLIHSGYMHFAYNAFVQLVLGFLLEMVHGWWRVLIIYFSGVIAGSLATSIFNPTTYLAGASGGVYALIFAHMSTVVLNWKEMKYPEIRVALFTLFTFFDVGMALYYNYIEGIETNVGYPAHGGGALAGFVVGMFVLRNLELVKWEKYLIHGSVFVCIILTMFAICWNLFTKDYFPPLQS